MKILWVLSLLFIAVASHAAETVTFDSSFTSASNTSLVVGGSLRSAAAKVTVRLSVDGAVSGDNFKTQTLESPYSNWNLATTLGSGTYASGPHTIVVTVVAFGTTTPILASASNVMTVELAQPHVWLSSVGVSPNSYPVDNVSDDYFLFNTDQIVAPLAAIGPATAPPDIKSLTVTLLDNPAGTAEILSTTFATNATQTVTAYSSTSRQLTITAASSQPGSVVAGWIRDIRYRYNTASNPIVGSRRVAFQVTTTLGLSSEVSLATISVKSGLPIIALTGMEGGTLPIADYKEGTGQQVLAPDAVIINQSPVHRDSFRALGYDVPHYYEPPQLYRVDPYGGITYLYDVPVLDEISVRLENPDSLGLFASTVEYISFNDVPLAGTFNVNDIAGNYFFYDGNYNPSNPAGTGLSHFNFVETLTEPASGVLKRTLSTEQSTLQSAQNPIYYSERLGKTPGVLADFQDILRRISYVNLSDNMVSLGNRRVITVQAINRSTTSINGGAVSEVTASAQIELRLIPKNKAPQVSLSGTGVLTMWERNAANQAPLALDRLQVSDSDGNNGEEWLTLTVSSGTLQLLNAPSGGSVQPAGPSPSLLIKGTVNNATGTLQSALSSPGNLLYRAPNGFYGEVTLKYTLNDKGNTSPPGLPTPGETTGSFTIYVEKANQPPVLQLPGARVADQNSDRVITGIEISDADLPATSTHPLLVRLESTHGNMSLVSLANLDFATEQLDGEGGGIGDGVSDPIMQFRGEITDISNALRAITYRPVLNYYGSDVITVTVNDLSGVGLRAPGYVVPSTVVPSTAASGASQAWINSGQFAIDVRFVNQSPTVAVVPITVAIGSNSVLNGGLSVPSLNYPPGTLASPIASLPDAYMAPIPANAGTSVIDGSKLIASDNETKDENGLTYTVNLPVSQGSLVLQRPLATDVILSGGSSFTQADLNAGYIRYKHNGALSGDDGFVFSVRDDNSTTRPNVYAFGQVDGVSGQQIFPITIDRTRPIAIFNGSAVATFQEPVAPASAVPVLIDNDPLTRVVNATDPTNFVTVGNTGRLTATVLIPTSAGVNPGTVSSDPFDTLTIRDQPPIGFTGSQLFYNGSPIGSYAGGQGTPLVVTFSSALPISVSAVSELLRHIEYSNPGANPSASQRIVTVTVLNGAGQSSMVTSKAVNVVPYNDAPVITPPSRALVLVPGLTLGASVQATDPDGVLSYALSGSPPTRGLVTVDATSGAFTYTPAPNSFGVGGALTDQFEITVSDPGILTDPASKTATQLYQVRITDLGAAAPVFTSNPPLETVLGRVLTYAPQVRAGGAPGGGNLVFSLVGAPPINPGLGFDPATGTITWPANWTTTPAPTADSYQQFGLLVVDQSTDVAAYQPILLKVLLTPQGSN